MNKNATIIFGSAFIVLEFILFFRKHEKNKTKSNKEKHTRRRSGKIYDNSQNNKRGNKNKKYKKKPNPNKKKKKKSNNKQ